MSTINKTAAGFDELKARIGKQLEDGKMYLEQRPYISTGLRGAALGAGTFATIAAVKEVLDLIEDRKKKKKARNPTLSSDTIVISLPGRNKEKLASARDFALEEAKKHDKKPTDGSWRQARHEDGTFASGWELDLTQPEEKNAQEKVPYEPGWAEEGFNMGLSGATGVIGAGLGWVLAQKTYDYLKKKRLKREIAAAQKEYIDFLTNEKDAQLATGGRPGVFNNLLHGEVTMPDGATEAIHGLGKYSIGTVTSTAVLLALASTYLTKKFLDQKFNDLDTKTTINDKPNVNNIVFKTAEAEEISITPLDAVAAVKFAELMLEADSVLVEKKAQLEKLGQIDPVQLMDAVSKFYKHKNEPLEGIKDVLGMTDDELFDAYVNDRDGLIKQVQNRLGAGAVPQIEETLRSNFDRVDPSVREAAMDQLMEAIEANGYQGGASSMTPEQLYKLENVHRYFNRDDASRDATMKMFLSDRYKKYREAMATNYLNNWYNDSWFGKAFGADSGFGNLMKKIMGWFGRYYANTETGGKNMYNRMMQGIGGALQNPPAPVDAAPGLQPPNPGDGASPEAAALLAPPKKETPAGLPLPNPSAATTPAVAGSGLTPPEPTWGPAAPASRAVGQVEQATPAVQAEPAAAPSTPVAPAQPAAQAEQPAPAVANNGVGTPDFGDMPDKYRPNGLRKGAGLLDSKLLAAASRLAVTTDTRNDELNGKLDKIIEAQAKANAGKNNKQEATIKIIAADPGAKEMLKKRRQVVEQVLRELKAQGKI